jgi:hypothetical protein
VAFAWRPIEDLPADYARLESPELPALARVWYEQKGGLAGSGALDAFLQRLARRYLEPASSAAERFQPWLERCLARGLEVWRAGL